MNNLPRVGSLDDESDAPFTYLALTSKGDEHPIQGLKLTVECESREQAIQLGRSHFSLLTLDDNGDHFGADLIEDWAYRAGEDELLIWEVPEPEIIVETEGVTVIQTKRPGDD